MTLDEGFTLVKDEKNFLALKRVKVVQTAQPVESAPVVTPVVAPEKTKKTR